MYGAGPLPNVSVMVYVPRGVVMLPCLRSAPSTVPFRPIRAVVVRNLRVSVQAASRRTQNDTRAYVREVWLTMITVRCDRWILVLIPSSFLTQVCQRADVRGYGPSAAAGQAPRVSPSPSSRASSRRRTRVMGNGPPDRRPPSTTTAS